MSAPNSTTHAVRSKRGCDRLRNTTRTCTCLRDAEAHIGIIVYEAAGDILQPRSLSSHVQYRVFLHIFFVSLFGFMFRSCASLRCHSARFYVSALIPRSVFHS